MKPTAIDLGAVTRPFIAFQVVGLYQQTAMSNVYFHRSLK